MLLYEMSLSAAAYPPTPLLARAEPVGGGKGLILYSAGHTSWKPTFGYIYSNTLDGKHHHILTNLSSYYQYTLYSINIA